MSDYQRWLEETPHGRALQSVEVPDEYRFFDFSGESIPYSKWAWINTRDSADEYRHIDQDQIGEYVIKTMWTGIDVRDDESLDGDEPNIYTTIVVHWTGEPHVDESYYWTSVERAEAGHKDVADIVGIRLASAEAEADSESPGSNPLGGLIEALLRAARGSREA